MKTWAGRSGCSGDQTRALRSLEVLRTWRPSGEIRASDTAEFLFEGCRVPASSRLGEQGQGFKIAMTTIDTGRIGIGAQAVGIAVAAYEASVTYARERKSFGVPIGS